MEIVDKIKWKADRLRFLLMEEQNRRSNRFKFHDNIVISGSGRSGTTWIAEVLASLPHHTLVNEPLKNSNSYKVQEIGFTGWGQYIPEEADWPEAHDFFTRLFTGRELNPNYFTDRKPTANTKVWVHKFIRIPFMLPWIVKNFPTRKPIHIIRNPYAVVASQLQHAGFGKGKIFDRKTNGFVPRFDHYDSFYQSWQQKFDKINSYTEKLALHWAFENSYVLNHPRCNQDWIILYYEDFLLNPHGILSKLSLEWEIDFGKINESVLKKQSYSLINDVPEDPQLQLMKWERHLDQTQIGQITEMIKLLEMNIYNVNTGLLK